ncbi:nucleoside recognition domain-containing protein [Cohnella rhizosphaerae]|uniref:Sporulation integral membrane protein YlbJ n=1 Tax=Cohnella rhizosphaerae TaxID=1457232 RepID=A0A9X4L1I3_9BACL|nr:nucleoside recognition domain-containing protein [Cohnella rhizosphaerae]MDG0814493.1 sporulation integral membrane protein YlbJ [Cohnella rhizosphaerae]
MAAATGAGACVLLIGLLALLMPGIALEASLKGLSVWWEVLFPALFPFFVLSEVLLGFGIVHLAAALLDPLMRPLFRIPGAGGFVLALSFGAGYPIGARLTSQLMEQNLLSRGEGERLVAMTTTSDPIFLIGAVCLGFFGRLDIVPVLAAAHYGGAMLVGLLLRWRKDEPEPESEERSRPAQEKRASPVETPIRDAKLGLGRLKRAIVAMHEARMADGRPFGIVLNQAVKSSLALMIVVGGLVVCFSATLQLLLHGGLLLPLKHAIVFALQTCGLEPGLANAFVQGTFEVTLGNAAAASRRRPGRHSGRADRPRRRRGVRAGLGRPIRACPGRRAHGTHRLAVRPLRARAAIARGDQRRARLLALAVASRGIDAAPALS